MKTINYSKQIKKDLKNKNKDVVNKLQIFLDIISQGINVSFNSCDEPYKKYKVHPLTHGEYKGCMDAHICPNVVLIYKIDQNNIYLIRFGSHGEIGLTENINKKNIEEARQQTALKSNGIYSVLKDEWIKEPVAEDIPEIDMDKFNDEFKKWEDRYFDIIETVDVLEEEKEKQLYSYSGPVYVFNDFIKQIKDKQTRAVSLAKAISNLKFTIAKEIGLDRSKGVNIRIREDDVRLVKDVPSQSSNNIEEPSYGRHHTLCPNCKKVYLNDAGECPLCDLGDESVLDESLDYKDKIEEIENFIEDIYDLRKTSIINEGEYGIGNLVFKECRALGYLDNLKELKNKLKSKKLSLESIV